jgi:hypothetical protein
MVCISLLLPRSWLLGTWLQGVPGHDEQRMKMDSPLLFVPQSFTEHHLDCLRPMIRSRPPRNQL